jgi:HdeA/HdeB family
MTKTLLIAATVFAAIITATSVSAQQDLFRGDQKMDVQALTCGQLANTYQEDADALTMWYAGWYNGLAKGHMFNLKQAKQLEHELIMYCKANQDKKIIEGIAVVFKDERAKRGIKLAD